MRSLLHPVVILAISIAAAGLGAPAAGLADVPEAPPLVHKACIEEPVFNRTACIYEANRDAAQTVVLVHGLNGRADRDWAEQIPLLAREYHVLSFDLPGFGDSDKPGDNYSPKRYADFIHFVTQRYARRPFYLVGHSMGGAIALRYSGDHPEDVQRLVLADVAGVLHRMAYARLLATAWLENNARYGDTLGGFFDRMTYKLITKAEGISGAGNDYLARKLLEKELGDTDPAAVAAYTLANEDLGDALNTITVPTLLLWGEEDRVAPLRTAHALKARLPQARLVVIPEAAHSPMLEATARFNDELLRFFHHEPAAPMNEGKDSAAPIGEKEAVCTSRRDVVYEGDYARLTLNGCDNVVIRNARIGRLFATGSVVFIENSQIGTDSGNGLIVIGAELTITATEIRGEVPIHASRSRLDLAAVTLRGERQAVTGERGSSLIFSISRWLKAGREYAIHGYYEVDAEQAIEAVASSTSGGMSP